MKMAPCRTQVRNCRPYLQGNHRAIFQPWKNYAKELFSYLAIASNVPNATFIVLHAIFGQKFSMKLRIVGSQVKKTSRFFKTNLQ